MGLGYVQCLIMNLLHLSCKQHFAYVMFRRYIHSHVLRDQHYNIQYCRITDLYLAQIPNNLNLCCFRVSALHGCK